jgi:hypothetical protein
MRPNMFDVYAKVDLRASIEFRITHHTLGSYTKYAHSCFDCAASRKSVSLEIDWRWNDGTNWWTKLIGPSSSLRI